jgi:phosphoribosyl-ATP pyrophosphohydrolase
MKNNYEQLEALVIDWAREKGILDKATPMAQGLKTLEETHEMLTAILADNKEEVQDSIGDQTVTLIIQAEMQGLKFVDCLQSAYDIISKRKGVMKDGVFVKDNE